MIELRLVAIVPVGVQQQQAEAILAQRFPTSIGAGGFPRPITNVEGSAEESDISHYGFNGTFESTLAEDGSGESVYDIMTAAAINHGVVWGIVSGGENTPYPRYPGGLKGLALSNGLYLWEPAP